MADTSTTIQKVSAEVLGTFVLVFFGCGSVVFANNVFGGVDFAAVGLTFGLAVMLMAYAVGRVSGAHFNPAVTVGAAMGGRMSWKQVPLYIGSQLGGAILAALVLFVLAQGIDGYDSEGNMGQNFFGDHAPTGQVEFAWWAAFLAEALLTLLFILVILAVTDARNEHPALAPLAIGLTLSAIHFVAIPLTGTSVNPARSIGPALFAGGDAIVQLWLFILAPLLGGALGGLLYPLLFGHGTDPVPGSGLVFNRAQEVAAAVPGYGAPDQFQQEWNQQAAQEQAAWEQEPIIQDGWQWDHAAQEWKPLEQWQPAPPAQATQATPAQPVQPTPPATDPAEQPPAQPDQGTGTTQFRPPE
jgi:aquaporin Z